MVNFVPGGRRGWIGLFLAATSNPPIRVAAADIHVVITWAAS